MQTGFKVLALISGGKDSIYNLCCCLDKGHQVVALGNLYNPAQGQEGTEIDSYMYQTVGTNTTLAIAQALEKPIYRRPINGTPKVKSLEYTKQEGDEVEDLELLVQDVLTQHPQINAVSSGAIFSTYQKLRVQNICNRHGLTSLAYLWQRSQPELLDEMINYGIHAILIKVACFGLNKQHLGRTLKDLQPYFAKLQKECEMNVCGQGGEYQSLVLDCPHFKRRLVMQVQQELVEVDTNQISPVAYLKIGQIQLQPK